MVVVKGRRKNATRIFVSVIAWYIGICKAYTPSYILWRICDAQQHCDLSKCLVRGCTSIQLSRSTMRCSHPIWKLAVTQSSLQFFRLYMAPASQRQSRENEIRRKILELKREGKLGKKKERSQISENEPAKSDDTKKKNNSENESKTRSQTELGILESVRRSREREGKSATVAKSYEEKVRSKLIESQDECGDVQNRTAGGSGTSFEAKVDKLSGGNVKEESFEDYLDENEVDTLKVVAKKLAEKAAREKSAQKKQNLSEATMFDKDRRFSATQDKWPPPDQTKDQAKQDFLRKTTTGVGGSWSEPNTANSEPTYKPSRGSWGAFPRPKDISKAYGGGRRVGAGVVSDAEEKLRSRKAEEETKARLRAYRENAGIEVQSERDHEDEIKEALAISSRAMARGVYATAVAVLEQITPYCSTNSKMGGKVFLELAMAYEAVGRADEAITVYSTLSRSRIQDIRFNAQRLLYGIEAINFMRNEAHDDNFSRKKVSQDFIDATGFNKIAEKFDKRYTTAYVDMKNPNFYKRLTENVVRSTREARLIILKAIHHGEVGHLRIIQALQTINREFDSAMRKEAEQDAMHERKSIAVMNGVPIQRSIPKSDDATNNPNEFALGSPDQMLANFDGEWRLQLVADKKGDGVTFFYSKVAWQRVDIDTMIFETCVPSGFAKIRQKGYLQFLGRSRLIEREQKPSPKSWLDIPVSLVSCTGPSAACQQILAVDSELCITRQCDSNAAKANTLREYFSVWRRVEKGTFSRAKIT